jgi:hypothetical protein
MLSKMKTCEDYRAALIETAAVGAADFAMPNELRRHLDACASCRAAYAEELQLLGAIDTGLRVTANSEVPGSLLLRVRAQIHEQRVPHRSWIPAGMVMAAAVVLLAAVIFVRGRGRVADEPVIQVNSPAPANLSVVMQPAAPSAAPPKMTSFPAQNRSIRPVESAVPVEIREAAVLLPAGQKRAMEELLASLQRDEVHGEVLLAEKTEKPLEELQVSPVEVSPIELNPLADVSPEPAPQNEKVKQ